MTVTGAITVAVAVFVTAAVAVSVATATTAAVAQAVAVAVAATVSVTVALAPWTPLNEIGPWPSLRPLQGAVVASVAAAVVVPGAMDTTAAVAEANTETVTKAVAVADFLRTSLQ